MSACLSSDECRAVRSALTGAAREWWEDHERDILELTREELRALASGDLAAVTHEIARNMPREEYTRWRDATTSSLRRTAVQLHTSRMRVLDALWRVGGALLRTIAEILSKRVLGRSR